LGVRVSFEIAHVYTVILDLSQIRQPETDLARRYEPSAFDDGDKDFRVVAPVELRAKVHKDKQRFRLVGGLTTVLELPCSRCLEPFRLPVDATFDLRYLPMAENLGPEQREMEEDDLSEAFYRDDVIDLRQLMQEQFYLALPMKPLHSPDCKGLCPNCGTNLNLETCECQVRWEDPRLAGLKALMNRDKHDA
jgi:uncharacterized protein